MRFVFLPLLAGLLLSALPARALIVFGVENGGNTTAPANGAPWAYVGASGNATGIYIGHGYVLQAAHFTTPGSIDLGGVSYPRDTTFTPVVLSPHDLRIIKIVSPPALPELPLMTVLDADLGKDCTLIGTGLDKGAFIDTTMPTEKGWAWGTSRYKRWGLNKTLNQAVNVVDVNSNPNRDYEGLKMTFDQLLPSTSDAAINESALTTGDSGSGLFIKVGAEWKVAGVNADALPGGKSLYFSVPSSSIAIRVRTYSELMRFDAWGAAKLGTATPPEDGELDGDGIPNLLEYFLGLDPTQPDAAGAPQVGIEGTNITFTYRRLLSATDVSFVIEESSDLTGPWTTVVPTATEIVATDGLIRTSKATIPMGMGGMKFLRLRVTRL